MSFRTLLRAGALAAALFAAAGTASAQPGPPAPQASDELAGADAPAPEQRRRARPRLEVRPYVEVNAGVSADLSGGDEDVLTYSSVAAGVDGRMQTRRVTAQASYRYDRVIEIDGEAGDSDTHSGVAMVHAEVAPGVSLDAGALAARNGGPGRSVGLTPRDATAQVFSAYAGPTVSTQMGPLSVGASYRLGYVAVDDDDLAGDPFGDRLDESLAHNATASIGMAPGNGRLPIGWTVGAGYVRAESGDLDNVFEAAYIRGDIVYPVSPTLALTAGVGYENIDASQSDVLRDANGVPILVGGRLVADPNRPRLTGFDSDGLIYDGGIIWRPGPRTELQARAGRRYGGTTVTGSLRHQFRRGVGLGVNVYDSVGTSATAIVSNVNELPADFQINRNPLTGAFDGCVFGQDPGTGICFDQALQSLGSSAFRARGANILLSGNRGPWNFGLGGGYSHRRYTSLVSGDLSSLDPRTDQSFVLNAGASRRLSRYSGVSLDASASWYDSDRPLFEPVFSSGVTGSYYRSLMFERLQFHAALGIFYTDSGPIDSTVASALIGLRYTF
ncbi:MAG TPA: hypothetical protein VF702_05580 [Allosphingosinicella sp.]|jgi:uncharacterized protein (PEP-CTERM system associated)